MDLQLKGKVVVVTGGAKGIGAAIVRGCGAEGAIPVIVDRDEEAGKQLQAELEGDGIESGLIIAELSAPGACAKAVERTLQKLGRLDALVNNAGVNDGAGLEHGSP
jgi:L-fucose dehydrogenase